jgi:uncharacterized membrane protein YkvA (DUF1232 family)
MKTKITNEEAVKELEKGYEGAELILKDEDKLELLFQRLEKKLASLPKIGEKLSHVPVFASLVRSYVKKEYTRVPIGTIVAVISALVYFVSPVDLIPDLIPGVGHIDDVAVIGACLALADTDVTEYLEWREKNGKKLEL